MNFSDSSHEFNASRKRFGYRSVMELDKLLDPKKGFIVEDACIVGVEVFVCKSRNEKRVIQANNLTDMEFAALGRVLYFLKTRKRKDMNQQACKDLQG
ncbi:ubiquitin carboxyl-terminal hydrolase family protein, partial [Trifolium medium]|nr:ubiquitin carboxyl-terminal hydrolase family protein [Trifolium medium]